MAALWCSAVVWLFARLEVSGKVSIGPAIIEVKLEVPSPAALVPFQE